MIFKWTGRVNCFIQAMQCAKPHDWASTHITLQPLNCSPNYRYTQQYGRRGARHANHVSCAQRTGLWPFQPSMASRALSLNLPQLTVFTLVCLPSPIMAGWKLWTLMKAQNWCKHWLVAWSYLMFEVCQEIKLVILLECVIFLFLAFVFAFLFSFFKSFIDIGWLYS